jgi:hypothetical protein
LKINKKVIICQDHKFENKNAKDKEENSSDKKKGKDKNSQLKIEKGNDNRMIIKMSKIEENKDNEYDEDLDDFKIPKNKFKSRLERSERRRPEAENRSERLITLDVKLGDDTVLSNLTASVSFKVKKRLDSGNDLTRPKKPEKKLTYEDLQIQTPEEFDYENYDRDWCHYCGARYSSNFTKGPWGSRTLCTIHYIDWNQKKTLNLANNKDLPKRPIKSDANTELGYLQKMLAKSDREYTPEILESLKPTKKVKKNESADENGDDQDRDVDIKDEIKSEADKIETEN